MRQEKMQVTVPEPKGVEDGHEWVDANAARINTGNPRPDLFRTFNKMPPGYKCASAREDFHHGFGGDTDVSGDVVNPKALGEGFSPLPMGMTDEIYTNEHENVFYEDVGGFCERGNFMDRL